jgi:hypothetical protein
VTIKRDATNPSVTVSLARTPDHGDWYNHPVGYSATATDATSGVDSCQAGGSYSDPDDADAQVTRMCTDKAGNTGSDSKALKYDATNPLVTVSLDRVADHEGWYNHPVDYSATATDTMSGLDSCQADGSYSEPDNADVSVTRTCTDLAGNTGTGSASFKFDDTDPTISGSRSPAANGAGWNNGPVTVSYSCGDNLSGVASCASDETLGNQGADQSATGTAVDNAGNSDTATVGGIDIDLTAPGVTWNGAINNGDSYHYGSVPAAPSCTATDDLSGPNGCTVSGYSTAVGSHTLTATAHDKAGNQTVVTRSYTVLAWTLKGFYQPVDMNGVVNTVKNGSTVPLKFEIFAGATELTSTADVKSLTATQITCDSSSLIDEIEVTATGGTSLRYDATGGQFIYNWQTPKKVGTCYRVTMTTQDGSTLVALFKLK